MMCNVREVRISLRTMMSAVFTLALFSASTPAFAASSPVVVELYQAQGCSACVPADANIAALAERPDLIVLNFSVDYRDQLGWKDTFAKRDFTMRQWDYAGAQKRDAVATPQVIVDGQTAIIGNDAGEIDGFIGFRHPATSPAISFAAQTVSIAAADKATKFADVWLVRYDPRILPIAVQRGENGGKTLALKNIVKEIRRIGGWKGDAQTYVLPPADDPVLKTAILVQGARGGPIVAAAKLD